MASDKVCLGTELKINIHIDPIDSAHMNGYDFDVDFYCSPKKSLTIRKAPGKEYDTPSLYLKVENSEDDYLCFVDTKDLGHGKLKCKVTAYVEDEHFPDGIRTEVVEIDTGIEIVRGL